MQDRYAFVAGDGSEARGCATGVGACLDSAGVGAGPGVRAAGCEGDGLPARGGGEDHDCESLGAEGGEEVVRVCEARGRGVGGCEGGVDYLDYGGEVGRGGEGGRCEEEWCCSWVWGRHGCRG